MSWMIGIAGWVLGGWARGLGGTADLGVACLLVGVDTTADIIIGLEEVVVAIGLEEEAVAIGLEEVVVVATQEVVSVAVLVVVAVGK